MELISWIMRTIPVGLKFWNCHQTAINGPKSKPMQANGFSRRKRLSN